MAAEYPTLLDIAIASGNDAVVGLVDEASKAHPELTMGFARTIEGISYKTLIRTGLPTVGFRDANEGVEPKKGTYENRRIECYIFNPRWECDKAVADVFEDGPEAFIALEAAGIMEGSMQHLASQFYYGVANDAKGFPGLQAMVNSAMVLDAGGTTDNVASSVYGVRWGPRDVGWVWGRDGTLDLPDATTERVLDSNSKVYTAYCQEILAHTGLQVANKWAVGRLKDLTTDSGKGLTDDLLGTFLDLWPVGKSPDVLLMTKRSRRQLQQSRTATNETGRPAPVPSDYEGIPIVVTEALVNTEALS